MNFCIIHYLLTSQFPSYFCFLLFACLLKQDLLKLSIATNFWSSTTTSQVRACKHVLTMYVLKCLLQNHNWHQNPYLFPVGDTLKCSDLITDTNWWPIVSVWPAGRPFIYQTKHPSSTVSISSLSLGRRSAVPVCPQVGGALGQTRPSPLRHPSLCSSIMPFPPEGTRVTTSGHSHLDVPGTSQPGSHSSATSTKPCFHLTFRFLGLGTDILVRLTDGGVCVSVSASALFVLWGSKSSE